MNALDRAIQREMPRYLTNSGHGFIWERPDKVRFRCSGRLRCRRCQQDAADLDVARERVARNPAIANAERAK